MLQEVDDIPLSNIQLRQKRFYVIVLRRVIIRCDTSCHDISNTIIPMADQKITTAKKIFFFQDMGR